MKKSVLLSAIFAFGFLVLNTNFATASDDKKSEECTAKSLSEANKDQMKICCKDSNAGSRPNWCNEISSSNDMRSDCKDAYNSYKDDAKDTHKDTQSKIQDLQNKIQEKNSDLSKIPSELQEKLTKIDQEIREANVKGTERSKEIFDKINELNMQLSDLITTKTRATVDAYKEATDQCSRDAMQAAQDYLTILQARAKAKANGAAMMGSVSSGFGRTSDLQIVKKAVMETGWRDSSGKVQKSYKQCMANADRAKKLAFTNLKVQENHIRNQIQSDTTLLNTYNQDLAQQLQLLQKEKINAQNAASAQINSLTSEINTIKKQMTEIALDKTALNTDIQNVIGSCCRKVNKNANVLNASGDESSKACKDLRPPYPPECLDYCEKADKNCINTSGYGGSVINNICKSPNVESTNDTYNRLFMSDAIFGGGFGSGAAH